METKMSSFFNYPFFTLIIFWENVIIILGIV